MWTNEPVAHRFALRRPGSSGYVHGVLGLYRRSKLQRLAEPLIVQDEYEPLLRSTKQSHLPVALARMVTLRFMPSTRCSTEWLMSPSYAIQLGTLTTCLINTGLALYGGPWDMPWNWASPNTLSGMSWTRAVAGVKKNCCGLSAGLIHLARILTPDYFELRVSWLISSCPTPD